MLRTITVKGVGRVSMRPDLVVLSMKVTAKHMEYDQAMEMTAQQLSQIKECIVSLGFERETVKTTNFDVSADYDSCEDRHGNYQRVFKGFKCTHQLKLSFDLDTKKMSQVFSAVASCPAHPELRISFTAKDPSSIKDALLCEATANARKKAELLCNASGAKLGQLLTIEYNWGELDIHSNSKYKMDGDYFCDIISPITTSIEIEPENIDVCDTATFVWEIG